MRLPWRCELCGCGGCHSSHRRRLRYCGFYLTYAASNTRRAGCYRLSLSTSACGSAPTTAAWASKSTCPSSRLHRQPQPSRHPHPLRSVPPYPRPLPCPSTSRRRNDRQVPAPPPLRRRRSRPLDHQVRVRRQALVQLASRPAHRYCVLCFLCVCVRVCVCIRYWCCWSITPTSLGVATQLTP